MADKTWLIPDGIYTALVTPFTADGAVDRGAWRRLLQRQVDAGVAGVVPVGCTGEAAVLSRDEREWLVRSAVEVCRGRCAVVAGSGTNCTRESIALTRDVRSWGADAAMLISPYYNKPQQAGLLAHYRAIARAVDIPQVIYNVPSRTAVNILPETAAQLASEPNVVALKEASGNLAQIEEAIARCDLKVYSGDDGLNFSIFGLGASGAISVIGNLLPGTLNRMWQAFAAGDLNRAWPLARSLDAVCTACFVETNPVPVKELLSMAGLCRRDLRLPLVPVSEKSLTRLVQFFEGTLATMLAQDADGAAA